MASKPVEQAFPAYAPRVESEFRAALLQVPLFGDENMLALVVNLHPTLTAVVKLDGRLWSDSERQLKFFEEPLSIPPNGVIGVRRTQLERGAILSLVARCETPGIQLGDIWAHVLLTHGGATAETYTKALIQGYLGFFSARDWPGSPIEDLHSGRGVIRTIDWTATGATGAVAVVPANRRWRVITGHILLSRDGSPIQRGVEVLVDDGVAPYYAAESPVLNLGPVSMRYSIQPDIPTPTATPVAATLIPFPSDLELVAGSRLVLTQIGGVGPGDLWILGKLIVREWYAP